MVPVSIDPATDSLSYWHATSEPLVPAADMPRTAEAVVVGGGLLGCWTAYWLARAGVQVVLLERTAIGWGATGRNGGFLSSGTAAGYPRLIELLGRDVARQVQQLTIDGQELAHEVVADEGISCDLRRTGTLSLALDDAGAEDLAASSALLTEDGFASELLDREGVQALIETPLGDRIAGGRLNPDGGLLHSGRYLAGIARSAERLGARLVQAEVAGMIPQGDGVRVTTSRGSIDAGSVVIALNAWSDTLVPELAGLVVPARGQILAYEPVEAIFRTAVGADLTPTGEYWQQTPDGSIILGGCRALAPGGDLGVREMRPTPEVTAQIEAVLPALFPALPPLRVARRWAGPMAFTADYLPVADAVPDVPHAWVTGGYCGHGMPYGPRVGQLLAAAVMSGTVPEDLRPFRLDRPSLQPLASSGHAGVRVRGV